MCLRTLRMFVHQSSSCHQLPPFFPRRNHAGTIFSLHCIFKLSLSTSSFPVASINSQPLNLTPFPTAPETGAPISLTLTSVDTFQMRHQEALLAPAPWIPRHYTVPRTLASLVASASCFFLRSSLRYQCGPGFWSVFFFLMHTLNVPLNSFNFCLHKAPALFC